MSSILDLEDNQKEEKCTPSLIRQHFFVVIASAVRLYHLVVIVSEVRLSHLVVIVSEAWQSRKEKLYYSRNEDTLFMR